MKCYYLNKFQTIQTVMSRQDADIDEMTSEFKVIERITLEKLDVNEKSFAKLEKKYVDIWVYVKGKISN